MPYIPGAHSIHVSGKSAKKQLLVFPSQMSLDH